MDYNSAGGSGMPSIASHEGNPTAQQLVDRLATIQLYKADRKRDLELAEQEESDLKQRLADYAHAYGTSVMYGSVKVATVTTKTKLCFPLKCESPEEYAEMECELRTGPFWGAVSSLNHSRLQACGARDGNPHGLREIIGRFGRERISTDVRLRDRA